MKSSGDLASDLGVSQRRLQRLTSRGLLSAARKTPGGHSRYGPAEEIRARVILALSRSGLRRGKRFERAVSELCQEIESIVVTSVLT